MEFDVELTAVLEVYFWEMINWSENYDSVETYVEGFLPDNQEYIIINNIELVGMGDGPGLIKIKVEYTGSSVAEEPEGFPMGL